MVLQLQIQLQQQQSLKHQVRLTPEDDVPHEYKSALSDQLISKYGEKFTPEEAQYTIDNLQ